MASLAAAIAYIRGRRDLLAFPAGVSGAALVADFLAPPAVRFDADPITCPAYGAFILPSCAFLPVCRPGSGLPVPLYLPRYGAPVLADCPPDLAQLSFLFSPSYIRILSSLVSCLYIFFLLLFADHGLIRL